MELQSFDTLKKHLLVMRPHGPVELDIIVKYYSEYMTSRQKLTALLHDYYPECTLETNLILDAFEAGIAHKISRMSIIDSQQTKTFILQLEKNYGLKPDHAFHAIQKWAEAYSVPVNYTELDSDNTKNFNTTSKYVDSRLIDPPESATNSPTTPSIKTPVQEKKRHRRGLVLVVLSLLALVLMYYQYQNNKTFSFFPSSAKTNTPKPMNVYNNQSTTPPKPQTATPKATATPKTQTTTSKTTVTSNMKTPSPSKDTFTPKKESTVNPTPTVEQIYNENIPVYKGSYNKNHMPQDGIVSYKSNGNMVEREVHNGELSDKVVVKADTSIITFSLQNIESLASINEVTISYSNGDTYQGSLIDGKKSGTGTYIWKSGSWYNGEWANDTMNGLGTYYFTKDRSTNGIRGVFSKGKLSASMPSQMKNVISSMKKPEKNTFIMPEIKQIELIDFLSN